MNLCTAGTPNEKEKSIDLLYNRYQKEGIKMKQLRLKKVFLIVLTMSLLTFVCSCVKEDVSESVKEISESTTKETTTASETTTEAPTTTPTPSPTPTPEPIPEIAIGDTVSNDIVEYTLIDLEFMDRVDPPIDSSVYYYSYYEADEGEDYLCMIIDVKNIDTSSMSFDPGFLSVNLLYDERYEYNSSDCGFTLSLENDGDFTYYGGTIAPLASERLYYLCLLPEEVAQGEASLVITITLSGGGEYQYIVR